MSICRWWRWCDPLFSIIPPFAWAVIFGALVYLWLYNAPSGVSSLGLLVRLLYPAEDGKVPLVLYPPLQSPYFQKFTVCLLFFIHSFIKCLGHYMLPLLLCPPAFTGHTFTKHQKKLSNGHYNLPLHQVVTSGIHLSCFFFLEEYSFLCQWHVGP